MWYVCKWCLGNKNITHVYLCLLTRVLMDQSVRTYVHSSISMHIYVYVCKYVESCVRVLWKWLEGAACDPISSAMERLKFGQYRLCFLFSQFLGQICGVIDMKQTTASLLWEHQNICCCDIVKNSLLNFIKRNYALDFTLNIKKNVFYENYIFWYPYIN